MTTNSQNTKVRFAVMGLNMGKRHAQICHLSDKTDLRWVIDLDESLAKNMAAAYRCNYSTMLEDALPDVDAVIICTPHFLHHQHGLAAIRAGKHVLIEKPFALTEQDCVELVEEAHKHGVKLMVGLQRRFLPAFRRFKEIGDSGEYGEPFNVDAWMNAYNKTSASGTWRAKKDRVGGGVLFSHACHYIDMMIQLMGEPVESLALGTRLGSEWLEGEGTTQSIYRFGNGAIGHLSASWGTLYCTPLPIIRLYTPQACLNLGQDNITVIDEQGQRQLYEYQPTRIGDLELTPGLKQLWDQDEHFAECILYDRTPETNGESALQTFRPIWEMYSRWN
jgi:predicted dehydrogenase